MSKTKDTGTLAKTIENLTGKKPDIIAEKDSMNYLIPTMQRLYNLIEPYQTTVQPNSVIFFNSSEENDDNYFLGWLVDLYHNASSTFSNMIDLRRNMLMGGGLIPTVSETDPLYAPTIEFLNKENEFGLTLQDSWEFLCFDYSLAEMFFVEVLYTPKDGTISSVVHHDVTTVRAVAPENPNIPLINQWQLSRDWGKTNKGGKYRKTATQGVPINNFNPYNWANDGARQLLGCKRYSAGNVAYAIPSFTSILQYAQLEAELARYSLNSVTKQFAPQTIVVLNGTPDKAAKDLFTNQFRNRFVGADADRVLFIWTTDANEAPKIMPFQTTDVSPMIELLDRICIQKISAGMGASVELIGATTGGQSLQNDMNKLKAAFDFYLFAHIKPMQKTMLQSLNKIFRVNGLSDVTVVTEPLKIDNPTVTAAPVPENNSNVKSII